MMGVSAGDRRLIQKSRLSHFNAESSIQSKRTYVNEVQIYKTSCRAEKPSAKPLKLQKYPSLHWTHCYQIYITSI
jgi:hypothetical protein